MLIRHLYFFIRLAEEKHFARAAKACNIAQPTLSAAIRKLEEDLNAALIVRGHRFLGLTPEGEKALEWGRQILLDYESLQKDLKGNSGLIGTMRLGVIPAAMPSFGVLSERVVANHPGVTIEIRSLTSRAIQAGLDTFEIDGGLTYLENEPLSNIRAIPLYRERYVFICRARHRFAARKSLGWLEAVSEPLCLLSDDMQNRRILDGIARAAGLTIRPQVISNSFLAVAAHVKSGLWCSIVPHLFSSVRGRSRSEDGRTEGAESEPVAGARPLRPDSAIADGQRADCCRCRVRYGSEFPQNQKEDIEEAYQSFQIFYLSEKLPHETLRLSKMTSR